MVFNPLEVLKETGQSEETKISLIDAALALASFESPGLAVEKYQNHVAKMVEGVAARHRDLLQEGAMDDAFTQLAAIKYVLCDVNGYSGDQETYDDLQNANLIKVIERRKGLPVSIALLFVHLGVTQGWSVEALNFPAHVICRIQKNGERVLCDPFNNCKIMQAADLRQMLKRLVSPQAELANIYYEGASKKQLLIRLQNNIKLRQIEGENYKGAISTVERMQMIDPDEFRLLLDAGVLYYRTGQALAAIKSLEKYLDYAQSAADRQDALALLQQIRDTVN